MKMQQKDTKELSNSEKGYLFERWVAEHFPDCYELIGWSSDKYIERKGSDEQGCPKPRRVYSKSSCYPDLEYLLHLSNGYRLPLSVECKWRAKIFDKCPIVKEDKLRSYKEYSIRFDRKVIIILGVGGEPDNPHDIYIIPLNSQKEGLNINETSSDNLDKYKREKPVDKPFFYERKECKLL